MDVRQTSNDGVKLPTEHTDGNIVIISETDVLFLRDALRESLEQGLQYTPIREQGAVIVPDDGEVNPDTCLCCNTVTEDIVLIRYDGHWVYHCPDCAADLVDALSAYLAEHQARLLVDEL